jgi:ubiquinone/menaquinone biosynthesis C-methylase UbiE
VEAFGKPQMLHYPLYRKNYESLDERQKNLSEFCFSLIENWQREHILEVGCGNGTQALFLVENYKTGRVTAIDLNEENIRLAREMGKDHENISYHVDNAQMLSSVEDNSVDILVCIESAFHYPDKEAFLRQVKRVLKPGGEFLIADILRKSHKRRRLIGKWSRGMLLHHWTPDQYKKGMEDAELKLQNNIDITDQVIRGYQGYRKWITRKAVPNIFKYAVYQSFLIIQCELNLMLLRRRRFYMVYHGSK